MVAPELVFYGPDKGASYGQGFRMRGIRRQWDALKRFLATATVPSSPEDVRLVAYRATEWDDGAIAEACIQRTRDRFGSPNREEEHGGFAWPSGEPLKGGYLEWGATADQLPGLVDFLAEGEPWPRQTLGPVALHFAIEFTWKDPVTDCELPGQRGGHASATGDLKSELLVTLSQRSFIQPELWFPFPEGAPGLTVFLASLEPKLPFKLLARHFRCAVPVKNGEGYRMRRMVLLPTPAA